MKVLTWLLSALLGLVVIALGLIYLLPGWDLYIVQSDSMKPVFQARDMIVTRPVPGMIRPGDIITYGKGTQKVTHRCVAVDGDAIITKGDANEGPDPYTMSYSNVAGVYLFKVPKVGYITEFISTKKGWYLSIVLPAGILVLLLVREIIREAFKDDDESSTRAVPPSR
jgi:signal peptidase